MSAMVVKAKKAVDHEVSMIQIILLVAVCISTLGRSAFVVANFNTIVTYVYAYVMNYHVKLSVYRMVNKRQIADLAYRILVPKAEVIVSKYRGTKKIAR